MMLDPERASQAAFRRIRRRRFCLMITESPTGPSARVVQPHWPEVDGTIWLGTDPGSRKVADVERSGRCLLVYQDDRHATCVSVSCAAEVISDPTDAARRFMPGWTAFWPDGPDRSFVAIRCVPDRLEIWDGLTGITPEPFGRASLHLARRETDWVAV